MDDPFKVMQVCGLIPDCNLAIDSTKEYTEKWHAITVSGVGTFEMPGQTVRYVTLNVAVASYSAQIDLHSPGCSCAGICA